MRKKVRVAILDKWWADPRRLFLEEKLGVAADGVMAMAWLKSAWAAKHRGTVLVPLEEFKTLKNWELVFEAQLAVLITEDDSPFVYLRVTKDLYRCAGKKPSQSRHYAVTTTPFRHQDSSPCHQEET